MIHNSLFISNFSKIISRVFSILLMLIFLFFLCKGLDYLYVNDDEWSRKIWHDFYIENDNIDNLFVGSSHVYNDIDPNQLDNINGMNNFNLSVAGMRMDAAYFSIKEAVRSHQITNIYLELYYAPYCVYEGEIKSDASVITNWRCINYLQPSINKLEFQLSLSNRDKYLETFIPFLRYREHLFDRQYIMDRIKQKSREEYVNYNYKLVDERGTIEYQNKGYYYTDIEMAKDELFFKSKGTLSMNERMSKGAEEYLEKIIDYCAENDIKLTFIVSPMYELQLVSTENYDAYYTQIKDIAKKNHIAIYDFNLCKKEYLDIQDSEYFMNVGHLNAKGAKIYTKFLWHVVENDESSNMKYFYNSFAEKQLNEPAKVFGLYYSNESDILNVNIACNKEDVQFRIIINPEEGKQRVVQDYDTNKSFNLPTNEHGDICIESKYKNNDLNKVVVYY